MTKYWFKPKKYGYGFFPISWEGWLATLIMLGLVFLSAYTNGFFELSETNQALPPEDGARFLLDVFLILGISTFYFEKKTDGKVKWNWGGK